MVKYARYVIVYSKDLALCTSKNLKVLFFSKVWKYMKYINGLLYLTKDVCESFEEGCVIFFSGNLMQVQFVSSGKDRRRQAAASEEESVHSQCNASP